MKDSGQWWFNLAVTLSLSALYLRVARLEESWASLAIGVAWFVIAAGWVLAIWLDHRRRPR